jgi:hypothetical protein
MSVRSDIGMIANAVERGVKADSRVDYGPVRDPNLAYSSPVTADFTSKPSSPYSFIMGIHRWGDTINKVTP